MDLQYWKTNHEALGALSEEDRLEVIMELQAECIREVERGKYDFASLDNQQKLGIIQRWYPKAYNAIVHFFPGFAEWPNDYPPVISNAINNMIAHICGKDHMALQFT